MYRQILVKLSYIKYNENLFSSSRVLTWMDRQAHVETNWCIFLQARCETPKIIDSGLRSNLGKYFSMYAPTSFRLAFKSKMACNKHCLLNWHSKDPHTLAILRK